MNAQSLIDTARALVAGDGRGVAGRRMVVMQRPPTTPSAIFADGWRLRQRVRHSEFMCSDVCHFLGV